jgi:single-stranded DNA-binding protein
MKPEQKQPEVKETLTVTGYIGKEPKFKELTNGRAVLAFSIMKSGKGVPSEWVNAVAWNDVARRINDAITKEDIKKLQVLGEMNDGKPYELQGKTVDGKQELVVSDIKYLAKSIEINGVIGTVQEKGSSTEKTHTKLFVLNNVSENQVDKFNVIIFADKKAAIPAGVELEKGKPIAVKGELRIERYLDQANAIKESTTIVAKHVERTPTKLRELVNSITKPNQGISV